MSPRLYGYTPGKVIIRIVLAVAMFGGMLAQLTFVVHNVPPNTRQFYLLTVLIVDAIPMLFIMISRDPSRCKSKSATHTDSSASLEPSETAGQGVRSSEGQISGHRAVPLWLASIVSLVVFIVRLLHSHSADLQSKMATLLVAGILSGCVTALLRNYGVIKNG